MNFSTEIKNSRSVKLPIFCCCCLLRRMQWTGSSSSLRSSEALLLVLLCNLILVVFLCGSSFISLSRQCSCSNNGSTAAAKRFPETTLKNVVFAIASASSTLRHREDYIKSWWRPEVMRGYVWVDRMVDNCSLTVPPQRVSEETASRFINRGMDAHVRIARMVSETFRLGLPDVHWLIIGDDDTVFVAENLVRVLSKYDHRKLYYVGGSSEGHLSRLGIALNLAFGGGGIAISHALAAALERMQDECLQRYDGSLWGGDGRIHACVTELGVPLTTEPGFHQFDISGNGYSILSAHPIAPAISLHHMDVIEPLFPGMSSKEAIQHLFTSSIPVDPASIFQQSICYSKAAPEGLSILVSWGYTVQILRGLVPPNTLEVPWRTFGKFGAWRGESGERSFAFKTQPLPADPCRRPVVFFMANASSEESLYKRAARGGEACKLVDDALGRLMWVHVVKEPMGESWHEAPRRQCCRIMQRDGSNEEHLYLHVGDCKPGETSSY